MVLAHALFNLTTSSRTTHVRYTCSSSTVRRYYVRIRNTSCWQRSSKVKSVQCDVSQDVYIALYVVVYVPARYDTYSRVLSYFLRGDRRWALMRSSRRPNMRPSRGCSSLTTTSHMRLSLSTCQTTHTYTKITLKWDKTEFTKNGYTSHNGQNQSAKGGMRQDLGGRHSKLAAGNLQRLVQLESTP